MEKERFDFVFESTKEVVSGLNKTQITTTDDTIVVRRGICPSLVIWRGGHWVCGLRSGGWDHLPRGRWVSLVREILEFYSRIF